MHILRSQFSRERKKISASKKAGKEEEISKWTFYEPLKFLNGGTAASSGCFDIMEMTSNDNLATVPKMETPPPDTIRPTTPRIQNTKVKHHNDSFTEVFKFIKSAKRKLDDSKDEFDVYGQYVASELRSTENDQAVLRAKYHINNILIDLRMGKYDCQYGNQSTSTRSAPTSQSHRTTDPTLEWTGDTNDLSFESM